MVAANRMAHQIFAIDKQHENQWHSYNPPPEPVRISWWPLALIMAFVLGLLLGR